MITRKIWHLPANNLTEADAIWLQGLKCRVEIQGGIPQDIVASGQTYRYVGLPPKLNIETTCEKQESMLQLKYGDELKLMMVYRTPSDTYTIIPGYFNEF
jgi:hypothetical protein